MKLTLTISIIVITSCSIAQTICDSISVMPDTVYLNQLTDSTAFFTFTYAGNGDANYSELSFEFPDSSNINITEFVVTPGVIGPYTFDWTYPIVYNNPNILENTIVNSSFRVQQNNLSIDCSVPVTFVINKTPTSTGIDEIENTLNLTISPNPVTDRVEIQFLPTSSSVLTLFDLTGKPVYQTKTRNNNTVLNLDKFSAGIYFLRLQTLEGNGVKRIIKK